MMGMTFDQVERYKGAGLVVEILKKERSMDQPEILDLGGYFRTLSGAPVLPCPILIPECNCTVADVTPADIPGYRCVSSNQPLPFRDGSFEITICMDVFEHIRHEHREDFLQDALRVTSGVLILAAPFYEPRREAADRWLAGYCEALLGEVNPMLREHLENGLPEASDLHAMLSKRNLTFISFTNGDLGKWRMVMAVKHLLQLSSGPEKAMKFEYDMLPWAEPMCREGAGYRDVYVIFKDSGWDADAARRSLEQKNAQIQAGKRTQDDDAMAAVVCHHLESAGITLTGLNRALLERGISESRLQRDSRALRHELHNQAIQTRALSMSVHEKNLYINELMAQAHQRHLDMQRHVTAYEKSLSDMRQSAAFRAGKAILSPLKVILKLMGKEATVAAETVEDTSEIAAEKDVLLNRKNHDTRWDLLTHKPVFSILVPVYNTDETVFRAMIDSVVAQTYPQWELCLVDDASTEETPRRIIREYAERDPGRIRYTFCEVNGGIAVATNCAAGMAAGEFLCLLDHDDLLTPDALMEVAVQLQITPDADYIYSDEDKVSNDGSTFSQPYFKPDFDPELLLCNNYLNHFSVIRRTVFEDVGGYREGFDGSQDYDLFLRLTEKARYIAHIPRILYHWRMVPASTAVDPEAKGGLFRESSFKALQAAIERRKFDATVEKGLSPGSYRVKHRVDTGQTVTIIIPTRNAVDLLETCVSSIERHTAHENYEILVVDNESDDGLLGLYLDKKRHESKNFRSIRFDGRFNFSTINNLAVKQTDSRYILFLNNDIEITHDGWLESMLEHAQMDDIGAVGAKLLYPDGRIQHAGVFLGMGGVAGHPFKEMAEMNGAYWGHSNMVKNYSAVTAACLMMRRDVFEQVGGFNEELAVSFGDIDLCMEIRRRGYRIVYTPYTRLIHHESVSRKNDNDPERRPRFHSEITYMISKWGKTLYADPYLNPNVSILKYDMSLRSVGENETLDSFRRAFSGFIPGMETS